MLSQGLERDHRVQKEYRKSIERDPWYEMA